MDITRARVILEQVRRRNWSDVGELRDLADHCRDNVVFLQELAEEEGIREVVLTRYLDEKLSELIHQQHMEERRRGNNSWRR